MTPLQMHYHQARKARLQRFAEAAQRPVSLPPPIAPEPVAAAIEQMCVKPPFLILSGKPWFVLLGQGMVPPSPKTSPKYHGGPRVANIQRVVADHYDVTVHDILSSRRTARVVKPRQIAMFLAKKLTLKSLPEVGRRFGRDHTTVLHAVRKIELLAQEDRNLSADLSALSAALLPKPIEKQEALWAESAQ